MTIESAGRTFAEEAGIGQLDAVAIPAFSTSRENASMYGELLPCGGGDPIPLLKTVLLVGRRENADIVLRFPNVSSKHCELTLLDGYWHVKDLGSSNGIKVNGVRVSEQQIEPGDKLSIARHEYEVAYEPSKLGAIFHSNEKPTTTNVFNRTLLESAGLEAARPKEQRAAPGRPKP